MNPQSGISAGKPAISAWRWALLGDVPSVLDSIWRRAEFYLFRPGKYVFDPSVGLAGSLVFKRFAPGNSVLLALYALLTVFVVTGPTIDTFCGLHGRTGLAAIKYTSCGVALLAACYLVVGFFRASGSRLQWRIGAKVIPHVSVTPGYAAKPVRGTGPRKTIAIVMLAIIGAFSALPLVILAGGIVHKSSVTEQCTGQDTLVWPVVLQAALIVLIPVIAWWGLRYFRRFPGGDTTSEPAATNARASLNCFFVLVGLWVVGVLAMLPFAVASDAMEAHPGPYLQTAWILIGVLMLIAGLAYPFARKRLDALPDMEHPTLTECLRDSELLNVLEDPDPPGGGRLAAAFITGIGMRPLQVVLPAAFTAITVPRNWLGMVLVALVFSGAVSTYGSLRARWKQVVAGVERWFFTGLPLPISVLVIILGVLRIVGEQYTSTVLEAAPIGTLFTGIAVAYLVSWFFESWINRWIAEGLLRLLGASETSIAQGSMEFTALTRNNAEWTVSSQCRLYIHGPGRIGVQGWQGRQDPNGTVERQSRFANYTFVELFDVLLAAHPRRTAFMDELQRQLRVYYYTLNVVVILAGLGLFAWSASAGSPTHADPVIHAAAATPNGVDLAARLTSGSEPALIVAASGGGTRAALYTAHALQGLQGLGQAKNVVLISGASGGGASAAAFVARFHELTSSEPTDDGSAACDHLNGKSNVWTQYRCDVTAPFISDVLDGMNEMRISGHVAMGQLLAESMSRRLFQNGRTTFQSITGADGMASEPPALILNSTVSGHPAEYSKLLNGRAAWEDRSGGCRSATQPYGWLAGGRIVYTNLGEGSFNLLFNAATPDVLLRFTVINDPKVELARAAALNANFPPVFPNAKVTVDRGLTTDTKGSRGCNNDTADYFVTDGGATENLSLLSALVVLRNALGSMSETQWEQLRPLHIVAIEASAVDYSYSQDRGVGAATGGAKERLAGGMTQLLLEDSNRQLAAHKKPLLDIHYLPLPLAFRSRGGFGTHWMYAETIKVTNPLPVEISFWRGCGADGCSATLHRDDIAALWTGLFSPSGGFCQYGVTAAGSHGSARAPDDALTVQRWVCGGQLDGADNKGSRPLTDYQVEAWEGVVKRLGPKYPSAPP